MPNNLVILHLDDSRIALKLVQKAFQGTAQVIGVSKLVDATAIIEREVIFDCFLVDHGLGDGNGFDFIKIIRGMDKYKDIPVILLTSTLTNKIAHRAMTLGVNCSIPKIISNEDLVKETMQQIENPMIKIIQKEYHEVYCVQWEHDGVYFQYSPDVNIIVSAKSSEETQELMEYKLKDVMNGLEFDSHAIHEMVLRRHLIYTDVGETTRAHLSTVNKNIKQNIDEEDLGK
ncbi:MAG: response regulator [Planctomycetes bacterium]|nr:response regulator [Planctomycetota bacterium]